MNLTNKLESYCNHKKSFSKDNRQKNEEEHALPSITTKNKIKNNSYKFKKDTTKNINIKNLKNMYINNYNCK